VVSYLVTELTREANNLPRAAEKSGGGDDELGPGFSGAVEKAQEDSGLSDEAVQQISTMT
jgi:hypothetical protein